MASYDRLLPALKKLLPARSLALLGREVSFIQRLRSLRASLFVWSVVLSRFDSGLPGFAHARAWYARLGGKRLCPRPFQKRFLSPASVRLFEQAFDRAVSPWRAPRRIPHVLARHFADVVVWDSSNIQVLDSLKPHYKGTRDAEAALKASLLISVFGLLPLYALVTAANVHDMLLFPPLDLLRAGTLLLFDKGYSSYERLRTLAESEHFFLCPLRKNGNPLIVAAHRAPRRVHRALAKHPKGVRLRELLPAGRLSCTWDLVAELEPQMAKDKRRFRVRLVVTQGPVKLHAYLTNLPVKWKAEALRELYRLRWQVELVFKELKSHLNLEAMPSAEPQAVKVFAWASLIALAVSRVVSGWLTPLPRLLGLSGRVRPALVTRALRGSVRLLAAALRARGRQVVLWLRLMAEELHREATNEAPRRIDSLARLKRLSPRFRPA